MRDLPPLEPLLLKQVTQLEQAMNILVFSQFGLLMLMCILMAALEYRWSVNHPPSRFWYLKRTERYPELPPGAGSFFVMVSAVHVCICCCCTYASTLH
jgi:hypothetical protein